MRLRKGETSSILASSIDSALLAVEVYNKPRTAFRSEAYITLMIIAWTKLFHAYFYRTLGNRYYYKENNKRYKIVDGERKAWDIKTCMVKYGKLRPPVAANLEFFIGLRNKIEHRHIDTNEVDVLIFGECQSLLYNYENTLIELFGEEHAINESLVFSLQFSRLRTKEQRVASRKLLSREAANIREYVERYRTALADEVFNSQEYSIKLLEIPKISNTNRCDLAIEYVRWNELSEEDRQKYQKLIAIVKDKVVTIEGANVGRLTSGAVSRKVAARCGIKFNWYDHRCFQLVFSIRPCKETGLDQHDTNKKYCHYDDAHNDYVFQNAWVDFLSKVLSEGRLTTEIIKQDYREKRKRNISDFE